MNNAQKLHAYLLKVGLHTDPDSLKHLLHLSCTTSTTPRTLFYARSVFNLISSPDTFSYNTIIKAYSHSPHPSYALSLFSRMRATSIPPDHFTFPFVIKSSARSRINQELHSLVFKLGFDSNIYVQNALLNLYGAFASIGLALQLFDEMLQRDLVSWSTMISCCVNNGLSNEALCFFQQMQLVGDVKPDEVTMLSVISAVSSLGALELGKWVDGYVYRSGLKLTVSLGTALVDMYSRCGSVDDSVRLFDEMVVKNVKTWTALINGLAVHGRSKEALKVFYEMKNVGLRPDHITFSAVLVACSHGGLVNDGWEIFKSIQDEYGMEQMVEHYGCMVDMLGRAGLLHEAFNFVRGMATKPNVVIWRTLLGACVNHNNLSLAEKVKEMIYELDPYHDGDYVLLSNVYGGAGRWIEKEEVRSSMKDRRIDKNPGYSLLNFDQDLGKVKGYR